MDCTSTPYDKFGEFTGRHGCCLIASQGEKYILKRNGMIFYKAKRPFQIKWILAAIIFVATLCITFNDLYGSGFSF
ncbi:MAG: hypothetical protein NTV06_02120 [candidate division Zixibacteria bacterium]|nr:hypothetical protein [candidate division Zixibacteria bacterium]